jgi:hypothetical protein
MIYERSQKYAPGMCSIDNVHISLANKEELSLAKPSNECIGDESSVNTEIMTKHQGEKQTNQWDPNDSDYSLGIRLQEMGLSFTRSERSESLASTQTDMSSSSATTSSKEEEYDSEVSRPSVLTSPTSSVSFSIKVKVVRVPLLDTLSDEEKDATWYSPDELHEIREDLVKNLRIMLDVKHSKKEVDVVCFRGLEYKAGKCNRSRTRRKAAVRNNILDEQEFQRQMNIVNPDDMAKISSEYSAPSVKAAIEMAERDSSMDFSQWRYFYEEEAFLPENEPPSPRSKRGLWRKGIALSTKLRYYKHLRQKEREMAI